MESGFQLPNSNFGPWLGAPLGGNGMGGGSFQDEMPFDIKADSNGQNQVVNCRLSAGSVELTCDDTDTNVQTGWIWARLDHSKQQLDKIMTVEEGSSLPASTVRYTIKTLYQMENGVVKVDYRRPPTLLILT